MTSARQIAKAKLRHYVAKQLSAFVTQSPYKMTKGEISRLKQAMTNVAVYGHECGVRAGKRYAMRDMYNNSINST